MRINEIAEKVGMTKRAIKWYEEKQLLSVKKDENGYRNYTEEDAVTLKTISIYRKLGIGIPDIRELLRTEDRSLLRKIYQEKLSEKKTRDSELEALKALLEQEDLTKADELLDYKTVNSAIESLIPGEWSDYFKNHFRPFLEIPIQTEEQRQALGNLLKYCDETTIKVPRIMKLAIRLAGGIAKDTRTAEEMTAYYRDMSEEQYQFLKAKVWEGAKLKSGLFRYHPVYVAQRKMQRELQSKGYNDIFIGNLKQLSPKYREYKEAMDRVNDRICRELGMYYDSEYRLVLKKRPEERTKEKEGGNPQT